ncbi:MAG: 2-oxo acid dehydrogenase subunit E2 [Spirochaetaceae bacterium]|jgi:pyruvate dehydrogenase E2 component (dihydrolipoamide acetyltransferase)|nr:2-oxo acid dehydrogenase subunit E2 [Spirochaetaceae bacterium]
MASILIMPRQGNTVESCIINEWKVHEGDSVAVDTPVCVVETDKATFEVPAGAPGTILKLIHAAGEDVPVLEPIAVIGAAGEDWKAALAGGGTAVVDAGGSGEDGRPAAAGSAAAPAANTGGGGEAAANTGGAAAEGRIPISPRARNLAAREGLPIGIASGTAGQELRGSGPGGRIIERDVAAALAAGPPLTAAARAALGPDSVIPPRGSGIGGRVTVADLGSAGAPELPSPAEAGAQGLPVPGFGEGAVTDTPIRGIRKLIADRMYRSLAESAQFTLNGAAPVSRLQALRARMKASDESLGLAGITINDLVLFAVSRTLPRYPFMNAHKIGDGRNGDAVLRTFERVHLGVAVDTPRGLMVPVVRNANLLSLRQIAAEAKRLAAACQNGSVKPEELSGSTFTVTNLGSLGVSGFTPVLNAPEVAILGVCGIELKPVAVPEGACCGEQPGVRFEPHIGFSLTINHQVVDGAPAARFLKALEEAIADIDLWLIA